MWPCERRSPSGGPAPGSSADLRLRAKLGRFLVLCCGHGTLQAWRERESRRTAEALLDRAWGRPGQAVELGGGAAIQVEPRPAPAPNGQDADQLAQLLAVLSEAGVLSEALGGGPGPVGRLDA